MKKLLLILSVFVVTFSAFAAELNPFAYGLSSSVNALNPMQLDIEYKLNAPATSVKVYLYDVDKTWEQEVTVQELLSKKIDDRRTAYSYTGWIDLTVIPGHLRGGENNINWRVDVKGAAVTKDLDFVQNDVKFYAPTSIDIDNNPENANFGTVFCIEGLNDAYGNDHYTSHIDAAGLYILNADGSKRAIPFQNTERYGYNGGILGDPASRKRTYFDPDSNTKYPAYSVYRVRVADDGRIFITSLNTDGQVLWEADPATFSATTNDGWHTGWKKVMAAGVEGAVKATSKRNCEHKYCGIYSLFAGNASTGDFIAGPNVGFDVRGGGDDLQLLMLSGCQQAIAAMTPKHFYCSEYNLGTGTTWGQAPNWYVFKDHVLYYTDPQVEYDRDGNIWFCQYRGVQSTYPTLVRYNRTTKKIDSEDKVDKFTAHLRTGAIRFNKDFTKLAIATKGTGSGGAVTIYPVKEDGWPDFNNGKEVSTRDKTSYTLTDFAWDYADNLYIASKNKEDSAGECIAVYATKRSADEVVSTPAASWRAFGVDCASDESYEINVTAAANQGSATITARFDAEGKVPSCTPVEVFAQSIDGYKFVCWKDDNTTVSMDNPYTFSAVKDVTLTAHFEAGNYNVTWWNLFKDGEDIYDAEIDTKRNARLYYLFMAYYNAGSGAGLRWAAKLDDGSGEYNLGNSCYTYTDELLNKDKNAPMYWLGEYLKSVVGDSYSLQVGDAENISVQWGKCMFAFINKVGYAKDYQGKNISVPQALVTAIKAFAPVSSGGEGKGEYTEWRPWWTNLSCELPNSLKYNNALPVTWTMQSAPYNTYDTYANNTVPGNYQPNKTPKWYQWNTAPKADQLLAWRDGGTTGRIVHHVYRDNMKLYATYVDAHLQENDPQPDLSKNPYDATNNDVLDLLANNNHASTPLNFTIDRKFVGGMYNTVCFPFDVYPNDLPESLKDAEILEFKGVTTSGEEFGESEMVLNFEPLTTTAYLEAGRAYLIKLEADVNEDLDFKGFQQWRFFDGESSPREDDTFGGVTFQGVFSPTTLPENAYILVANNRLAKVTEGNEKMKGFRGYFTWDDPVRMPPAKMSISIGKQTPTAIEEITDPQPTEQPAAPKVRKVMYDGQIYILRGEEVYTITGHRVK